MKRAARWASRVSQDEIKAKVERLYEQTRTGRFPHEVRAKKRALARWLRDLAAANRVREMLKLCKLACADD